MMEQIDLNQSVSKTEYKKQLPLLQANLYDLAHEVFTRKIPVMIVFEGWAASGKGGTIGVLAERLDPRGFRVVPTLPPRTSETRFPWMQRFWLKIPSRGQMVVFDTSWYRRVLIDRVAKTVKRREWEAAFDDIRAFEAQMAADGTTLVKFWMHIDKKEQARRLKKLLKGKLSAWQVVDEDRLQHKKYDRYLEAVEDVLARTNAPHAPWTIVEATDRYHARIKVMETIIRSLEARLAGPADRPAAARPASKKTAAGKKESANA